MVRAITPGDRMTARTSGESGRARDRVPLFEVLQAVGREIADLGQLACDLQTALSPLGRASSGHDHQAIENLQAFDLLAQRLHGVADFLGALAPSLPTEWLGNAAAAAQVVTLSDLARRLSCPDLDSSPAKDGEAGAFELFEADGE